MSERAHALRMRDQWTGAGGRDRARRVREWLGGATGIPADLGTHEGRVDLRGALLGGRPWTVDGSASADGLVWEGLDLSFAVLDQARLTNVTLRNCVLDKASCVSWRCVGLVVENCSFVGADLDAAWIGEESSSGRRSVWRSTNLGGANLHNTRWDGVEIVECAFRGMRSVWMIGCPVVSGTWAGRLERVVVQGSSVSPGRFSVSMAGVTAMSNTGVHGMVIDDPRLELGVSTALLLKDAPSRVQAARATATVSGDVERALSFLEARLQGCGRGTDYLGCVPIESVSPTQINAALQTRT